MEINLLQSMFLFLSSKCSTRGHCTKMKFSFKDIFSECDQIRRKLGVWSHLLKKSLMENFLCRNFWAAGPSKISCRLRPSSALYVNDLRNAIKFSSPFHFADDSCILR